MCIHTFKGYTHLPVALLLSTTSDRSWKCCSPCKLGIMDSGFLALLIKYDVPQVVIENFTKVKCLDQATFATWGEGTTPQAEMTDAVNAVIHGIQEVASDRVTASKLKQVWKACDKIADRAIEGKASGESAVQKLDIDAPMDSAVYISTRNTCQSFYNFKELDPMRTGDEKVHGRVLRQFKQNAPTAWPILNTKSMAHAAKVASTTTPPKQQRFGDMIITTAAEAPVKPAKMTAHNYFQCFELLTNTWMTIGCYDVQVKVQEAGKPEGLKQVKFAHFSDCEAYKFKFYNKFTSLIEQYDENKVLQYIIVVEELMRTIAWGLARRAEDPMPFGEALLHAVKDNSNLWNEHAYLLGGKNWTQPSGGQQGFVSSMGAVQEARSMLQSFMQPNPGKRQRVDQLDGPTTFCSFFNSHNGCKRGKGCPLQHKCSARRLDNRVCGATSHGAHSHDVSLEGGFVKTVRPKKIWGKGSRSTSRASGKQAGGKNGGKGGKK